VVSHYNQDEAAHQDVQANTPSVIHMLRVRSINLKSVYVSASIEVSEL